LAGDEGLDRDGSRLKLRRVRVRRLGEGGITQSLASSLALLALPTLAAAAAAAAAAAVGDRSRGDPCSPTSSPIMLPLPSRLSTLPVGDTGEVATAAHPTVAAAAVVEVVAVTVVFTPAVGDSAGEAAAAPAAL